MIPVSYEQLDTLTAMVPEPAPKPEQREHRGGGQPFDLDRWIVDHGLRVAVEKPWDGGRRMVLEVCPFNTDHADGSAVITQSADGKIGFKCHHNSCEGKGWRDVRELLEPEAYRGGGRLSWNGRHPDEDGAGRYIPNWHWADSGLYRGPDDNRKLVLNRPVAPATIIEAGRSKWLELSVNGVMLTLSAAWPGTRASDATKPLAEHGVSLTTKQVQILQEFVADALDVGEGFQVKFGADVLGWHDEELVLGQAEDRLRFVPRLDAQHVQGFGRRIGSPDHARKAWAHTLRGLPPAVWTICGAAAASPFMRWLPAPFLPFVVQLTGPRSTGKTTILRGAASLYGDPELLVANWNTTTVGLERLCESSRHLPIFLDETGTAPKLELLGPLVMMFATGTGRTRGAPDGMRPTSTWRNVLLSTGEIAPIQGTVGGAARRVLQVHRALADSLQVDALDTLAETTYGWPAVWLRNAWQAQRRRWVDEVIENIPIYESIMASHPGSHRSQGRWWALIAVGACALAGILGINATLAKAAVVETATESASHHANQLDAADRLLWAVADDSTGFPSAYNPYSDREPRAGYRGRKIEGGFVAVLRSPLQEIAKRAGVLDVDAAVSVLKDRELLDSEPGRLTKQVRIGSQKARCFVFHVGDLVDDEPE